MHACSVGRMPSYIEGAVKRGKVDHYGVKYTTLYLHIRHV